MEEETGPVDEGAPVEELATLFEVPPEGLHQRVRSSIHRRLLASDVADLSVRQVLEVFLEFVKMMFETIGGGRTQREDRQ